MRGRLVHHGLGKGASIEIVSTDHREHDGQMRLPIALGIERGRHGKPDQIGMFLFGSPEGFEESGRRRGSSFYDVRFVVGAGLELGNVAYQGKRRTLRQARDLVAS